MNVLVACEFSGVVREAFASRGHYAMSVDLLPTEIKGAHYRGDIRNLISRSWDLMIAFPPCTYLCVSGARWWPSRLNEQNDALMFVRLLMNAPIGRIAIENPVGKISSFIRKPDQIIQPWQFGEPFVKTMPRLKSTATVSGREQRCWKMAPSPNRSHERSRTYKGIANAMAEQWGKLDRYGKRD